MAGPITPCTFLLGKLKTDCEKAQQDVQKSQQNPNTGGSASLMDILTGTYDPLSLRHFTLRIVEVIIGGAMIIVGIKALMNSSATTKVIVQGAKKVAG